MCLYCRAMGLKNPNVTGLSIGLMPAEKVTGTGCDELWRVWCDQNREVIEKESLDWLEKNSRCITIMKLHALKPPKHHGLGTAFEKKS